MRRESERKKAATRLLEVGNKIRREGGFHLHDLEKGDEFGLNTKNHTLYFRVLNPTKGLVLVRAKNPALFKGSKTMRVFDNWIGRDHRLTMNKRVISTVQDVFIFRR